MTAARFDPRVVARRLRGLAMAAAVLLLAATPGFALAVQFDIPAETAILVEAETGRVLFAKNPDMPVEPASITKIMTLLLVMEAVEAGILHWDDQVIVSAHAASVGGSTALLGQGERYPVEQLVRAVAIGSANDASVALAEHLAGTEEAFVRTMNRRAAELGMTRTRFINADGMPPRTGEETNLTTVADIEKMARALLAHPKVLEWTSTWESVFRERPRFVLYNTNRLIRVYPGADGLKTGYTTSAGYCLAATAERDGMRLLSVVMGTESDEARVEQSARLLDYGFRNFRIRPAVVKDEPVGQMAVWDAEPEQVPVVAAAELRLPLAVGEETLLTRRLVPRADVSAPVAEGEVVGDLVVLAGEEELGRVPVRAARDVERAGLAARAWRWLRNLGRGMTSGD